MKSNESVHIDSVRLTTQESFSSQSIKSKTKSVLRHKEKRQSDALKRQNNIHVLTDKDPNDLVKIK